MSEYLKNKVALVTGGSRGIGSAIALNLAREGVNIMINYKSSEKSAEEIANKVRKYNVTCLCFQADVSIQDDREKLLKKTLWEYNQLDILVNNAGIRYAGSLSSTTQTQINEIMAINLVGPLLLARDTAEVMLKQNGGSIINVSSVAGVMPRKNGGMIYGLTKSGLIYLTQSLAKHYAPKIRVNAIAPGYTETDLFLEGHAAEISEITKKNSFEKD